MSARSAARLAWSLWTLAVILAVLFLLLLGIGGQPKDSTDLEGVGGILLPVIYPLTVVLLATMGALIASRHPQNWIGWLCCVWGLLFALEMFGAAYATSSVLAAPESRAPGAMWVAWLASMLNVHIALIVPVLLLFPDGQLADRRWRWVLWLLAASTAISEVSLAVRPGPLGSVSTVANPLGVAGADEALLVPFRLSIVGVVLAAAALAIRLRRARGDERQQLKWVVYAGVLLALGFLAGFSAPHEWTQVVTLAYFLILDGFLLTLGLAVLKYQPEVLDPLARCENAPADRALSARSWAS